MNVRVEEELFSKIAGKFEAHDARFKGFNTDSERFMSFRGDAGAFLWVSGALRLFQGA